MRFLLIGLSALGILAAGGIVAIYLVLHHYSEGLPDYRALADYKPKVVTRVHAGDGELLECTIIDMSETGARVRVDGSRRLPARFYLIDERDGIAYRARLVRSAGPEHGLELIRKFDLKHAGRLVTEFSLGEG